MEGFLLEVADAVNTTLDLETLMRRVAELVRRIIHYDVFAILLLNEKRQELRVRFQVGHSPEVADAHPGEGGIGHYGDGGAARRSRAGEQRSARTPSTLPAEPRCSPNWRCR